METSTADFVESQHLFLQTICFTHIIQIEETCEQKGWSVGLNNRFLWQCIYKLFSFPSPIATVPEYHCLLTPRVDFMFPKREVFIDGYRVRLSRKFMRLEAFQREITTIYQRHSNGWLPGRIFISNSSLLEMGPKRAALNTSFPAWLCRSFTLACKFIHFTEKFARKAWLCLLILVTTLKFENEIVRTWIKLLTDRSKLTFQRRILHR